MTANSANNANEYKPFRHLSNVQSNNAIFFYNTVNNKPGDLWDRAISSSLSNLGMSG